MGHDHERANGSASTTGTTFPSVTAQFVRLEVLDTTINPLVAEFDLSAPAR